MKKPRSKLDKLTQVWYEKLRKAGFKDIEIGDGVISNSDAFSKNQDHGQHTDTWRRSKEEYYHMAEYFLNHYKFKSNLDRIIWEYHVNGLGTTAIFPILNKVRGPKKKLTQQNVWAIVDRLRRIMTIGSYEEVE